MDDLGVRRRKPIHDTATIPDQRPERSNFSGFKVVVGTCFTLFLAVAALLAAVWIFVDSPIEPLSFRYPDCPSLVGPLNLNDKLQHAEHLFEGKLVGAESIATIGDIFYTGTADGKIIKIDNGKLSTIATLGTPPCGQPEHEPNCGRPLGLCASALGKLFVVDAYLGVFEVDPNTGETAVLVPATLMVEGQKFGFLNDLTILDNGSKIYFTDSSSRWQRQHNCFLVMEGTCDGRLLEYDVNTKITHVLLSGLCFANGVELSPAEDHILVCETTMARIIRYYIKGKKKGQHEVFAENLPGLPDNISPSSFGGYWVGLATVRSREAFSIVDLLAPHPWLKKLMFKLFSQEFVMRFTSRHGLVLELGPDGHIRRSLHDASGTSVSSISEVCEHGDWLYLGSYFAPFLARLRLDNV
uniref:Adipocyte plasma membrane-associated protein n=1 Tax=Eptatretus burgeri TaxID=7764 RepID=A0A8C4QE83_EPTBU